ncbi:hypothetical protein BP6252_03062 [Coleophoma cylindrospora]|uniref:Uncharacterized protein n=1 Tax=Coleophoma cylindrospora TaxID=1849047 RepID=A0A3D8S6Y2_9HELO|nr:hypothetical protein BP6252_03062 [Coleophoma cylindrospora]
MRAFTSHGCVLLLALVSLATPSIAITITPAATLPATSLINSSSATVVATQQITTPAPTILPEASDFLVERYWISTYYSCVTIAQDTHCGTHEEVLKGTGPQGQFIATGDASDFRSSGRRRSAMASAMAMVLVLSVQVW